MLRKIMEWGGVLVVRSFRRLFRLYVIRYHPWWVERNSKLHRVTIRSTLVFEGKSLNTVEHPRYVRAVSKAGAITKALELERKSQYSGPLYRSTPEILDVQEIK